jgi:hypothetical protein
MCSRALKHLLIRRQSLQNRKSAFMHQPPPLNHDYEPKARPVAEENLDHRPSNQR